MNRTMLSISTYRRSFILRRNIFEVPGRVLSILRNILATVLLLAAQSAHAQAPVQVIPQLIPPYTLTLSDYYNGSQEKLVVLLTNRDLTRPTISVRLRMTISGQSATVRSKDNIYYPPINLDAGIPTRLTLTDLAPYFNPNNLDFQGITKAQYQQSGKLPEGFYQFCFEAVELNTGRVVSQNSCSMAWLSLSDPPLLNLPAKGENVSFRDPLNIVFSWTPRNLNSPNSAFSTDYDFQLVEITDTTIDPAAAFQMAQPLYETTVSTTTLLYGPGQPSLLTGKKYAWRVQAKARSGTDQLDLYRNNGYSEVYWFLLQDNCQAPQQTSATIYNGGVHITWAEQPGMMSYEVDYRAKDQADAAWFSQLANADSVVLYDVTPGKSYEYRVGGSCSVTGGVTYGDIQGFTVPAQDTIGNKNCGILPNINTTNQTPLKTLNVGDVFMAGDFPVKVLASSGQGSYTGNGYVTVPFLGEARVKVKFSNIGINTDLKMISGVVVTTFDSTEKQVAGTDGLAKMAGDFAVLVNDLINTPVDNDSLKIDKLAQSILTAIDSLPPAIKDSIHSAVDDLQEAKTDYDHAKELYDSLPDGPAKDSAKNDMSEADSAYRDAQGTIVSSLQMAAAPPPVKYPVNQNFLVHYAFSIDPLAAEPVQVFSGKKVPEDFKPKIRSFILTKFFHEYGDTANVVFDYNPANIQFNKNWYENRLFSLMLYKYSDTSEVGTVADTLRNFTLNGNLIPGRECNLIVTRDTSIKEVRKDTLITGINIVSLKASYTGTDNTGRHTVDTLPSIIVQLLNSPVDKGSCYVKVHRKGVKTDKYCGNAYNLGGAENNETPLQIGETLTFTLVTKQNDSYVPVNNPVWVVNDNDNAKKAVGSFTFVVTDTLQKIAIWPDSSMVKFGNSGKIYIFTTLKDADNTATGSITVDFSHLKSTDTTLAKQMYRSAYQSLYTSASTFYNQMNRKPISLIFRNKTFDDFATTPGLNGFTTPGTSLKPRYKMLDVVVPPDSLDADRVIKGAMLIEKMGDDNKAAIMNAAKNKDTSGQAAVLLSRLRATRAIWADTLKAQILRGFFNADSVGKFYFRVDDADSMRDYLEFSGTSTINYNFDNMKAGGQGAFTDTYAHELMHVGYAVTHPYSYVKWMIIRKMAATYNYNLGDELDKNHPPGGGGCSAKDGHEKYNPENIQVCSFGQQFQSN